MKLKYEELRRQQGLPDLRQWLDLEDELTVRDVRVAFAEKLNSFTELMHVLVHPEDVVAMNEAALFSEHEHEELETLYNRLVLLGKESLLVDIAATPAEEIAMVKRFATEWPDIVVRIKEVLARTKDAYIAQKRNVFDTSYLG